MKINKISQALTPVLLLASSAILMAQSEDDSLKAYVSFGQNIAQNHSLSLTGVPWGGPGCYHAEFGMEFYHKRSTLLMRPNVGYTRLLSKPGEPERDELGAIVKPLPNLYDLLGVFIGFDLVYNVSKKMPLTVTAGPSFHSWTVEQTTNVPPGYGDVRQQGEKRMKLGWRMGVGYGFKDDMFRVDFTYTMTEWRSSSRLPYKEGFNPSLPSYFTLKGTYTF
ncbi:MAG: hypothetical protein LBC63_06405 [Holophagales bacterium]|jgi:hypothetical protein|nr:hypothetical protein [Holophagales bacterium]